MVNGVADASLSRLLSRLRLQQFSLLCGVAQGYSFRQLAERMALSPPAISKMARELESVLGQSVFSREPEGVLLTPLGELLAYDAQLILQHVTRIETCIDNHEQGGNTLIKVASPAYTAVSLLASPVAQLVKQHPQLKVELIDGVASTLFEHLRTGEVDFVVGSLPLYSLSDELVAVLEVEELYPDEVCFLTHKSSLNWKEPVSLAQLQQFSWVTPTKDSLVRGALSNALLLEGLPLPRTSVESSVVSAVGSLVAENPGFVGVLRADAAHYLAHRLDLAVLNMQRRIVLPPVAIIRRRHAQPTELMHELFERIRQRVKELFATSPAL